MILKENPSLRGNFKIICIDDEPFPNIIKSVPSMIIDNKVMSTEEIFNDIQASLEQQKPQQAQIPKPQEEEPPQEGEIMGVCENGFCSGFETLDNTPTSYDGHFASIDHEDPNNNTINVKDDGYVNNNKKSSQFDNDYETMMKDRGEIGQGKRPMM